MPSASPGGCLKTNEIAARTALTSAAWHAGGGANAKARNQNCDASAEETVVEGRHAGALARTTLAAQPQIAQQRHLTMSTTTIV
jgi:hypothetical protein